MNYYTEVVADTTITASQEDFDELKKLLEIDEESDDEYHGMDVEYYEGEVHMFCEENGNLSCLPEAALEHIGKMITKAKLDHWEFGISYTASRQVPGSRGGGYARILPDGTILYTAAIWPIDSES